MKKLNLLIILCFAVMVFSTLEVKAQREIGVSLNGLSNFGLVYKVKKAENKYLRYHFAYFDNSLESQEDRFSLALNVGFSAGIEKRKAITEDFTFVHGWMPGITVSTVYTSTTVGNNTVENGNLVLTPRLGYVIGGLYQISDKFYIGLDIIPSVRGAVSWGINQAATYNLTTNFNIDNVGLSVVYKLSGKG